MNKIKKTWNRRNFLKFFGKQSLALGALSTGAAAAGASKKANKETPILSNLKPSSDDSVKLVDGLEYKILASWKDPISKKDAFGFNCDHINYVMLDTNKPDSLFMMVNHEYPSDKFVSGYEKGIKTKQQADLEQKSVGCSLFKVDKNSSNTWKIDQSFNMNRRIDAQTPIEFSQNIKILGSNHGVGTLGNCSGGRTPWGHFLTCEENYQDYYGERVFRSDKIEKNSPYYAKDWEKLYANAPEHYGWVVEINPFNKKDVKKLIALGRFSHEGACVVEHKDGTCVVYMGDDKKSEHIYKFIADEKGSLETGTLYVANTKKGTWTALNMQNPILKQKFKSDLDILIHTRQAAKMVGASAEDRPEDIEVDANGNVYVALTNNSKTGNAFGSILKISEDNANSKSMTFKAETFIAGGEENGFACPDNIEFDANGNLWFTTDMSGHKMGKPPYSAFGNNGLFVVPVKGPQAGIPIQVASAPIAAEFTGPKFSPDGKTLFLSVQHPGETSKNLKDLTSHWPDGGKSTPKPSVICIQGDMLNTLSAVKA